MIDNTYVFGQSDSYFSIPIRVRFPYPWETLDYFIHFTIDEAMQVDRKTIRKNDGVIIILKQGNGFDFLLKARERRNLP